MNFKLELPVVKQLPQKQMKLAAFLINSGGLWSGQNPAPGFCLLASLRSLYFSINSVTSFHLSLKSVSFPFTISLLLSLNDAPSAISEWISFGSTGEASSRLVS